MPRQILLMALLFSQTALGAPADDEAKKRLEGTRMALVITFEKCTDLKCMDPIIQAVNLPGATVENKAMSKMVLDEVCKKKADLCAKIPSYLADKDKEAKAELLKVQAAVEEQKLKFKPKADEVKKAGLEAKPPPPAPDNKAPPPPVTPPAPATESKTPAPAASPAPATTKQETKQ